MARNTNRQGASFELKVMHDLEGHGYTCLRSSGSRGAVDVVAVAERVNCGCGCGMFDGTVGPRLLFIQCKITNPVIPPAERIAIQDLALRARALPLVAFWRVDENNRRFRVHYRLLTGPGPRDWAHWAPGKDN